MICKRGDQYCQKIGCDCFATAPMAEVDAELRAAGIDPEDVVKRTGQTLKLIQRNMELGWACRQ